MLKLWCYNLTKNYALNGHISCFFAQFIFLNPPPGPDKNPKLLQNSVMIDKSQSL